MKKLFLLIFIALSAVTYGQQRTQIGVDAGYNQLKGATKIDTVFVLPVRDTIAWNDATFQKLGRMTMRPQDHRIYYHNGTRWLKLLDQTDGTGGGSGTTYYPGYAITVSNDSIIVDTSVLSGYYVRSKDSTLLFVTPTQFATGLATKANTSHTHAVSDVINLQTILDSKLDSVTVSNDSFYTWQAGVRIFLYYNNHYTKGATDNLLNDKVTKGGDAPIDTLVIGTTNGHPVKFIVDNKGYLLLDDQGRVMIDNDTQAHIYLKSERVNADGQDIAHIEVGDKSGYTLGRLRLSKDGTGVRDADWIFSAGDQLSQPDVFKISTHGNVSYRDITVYGNLRPNTPQAGTDNDALLVYDADDSTIKKTDPISYTTDRIDTTYFRRNYQYKSTLVNSAYSPYARDGVGIVKYNAGGNQYVSTIGGWNTLFNPNRTDSVVMTVNANRISGAWDTTYAPWIGRHSFASWVRNDTVYISGGDDQKKYISPNPYADTFRKDAWIGIPDPSNGHLSWTQLTDTLPWAERILFGYVKHNDSFYVMGGQRNSSDVNCPLYGDVWRSYDCIHWTKISDNNTFLNGNLTDQVVSYGGYIYVIGGGRYNDNTVTRAQVHRSVDGVTWEALPDAPFGNAAWNYAATCVAFGKIFTGFGTTPASRQSWTWLFDGKVWERLSTNEILARDAAAAISLTDSTGGEKIVLAGGSPNAGTCNEVWTIAPLNKSTQAPFPSVVLQNDSARFRNIAIAAENGGQVLGYNLSKANAGNQKSLTLAGFHFKSDGTVIKDAEIDFGKDATGAGYIAAFVRDSITGTIDTSWKATYGNTTIVNRLTTTKGLWGFGTDSLNLYQNSTLALSINGDAGNTYKYLQFGERGNDNYSWIWGRLGGHLILANTTPYTSGTTNMGDIVFYQRNSANTGVRDCMRLIGKYYGDGSNYLGGFNWDVKIGTSSWSNYIIANPATLTIIYDVFDETHNRNATFGSDLIHNAPSYSSGGYSLLVKNTGNNHYETIASSTFSTPANVHDSVSVKVDSVTKSNDTFYYWKGGVKYFAGLDATGAGGSGITTLNSQTGTTQSFATGTSGTDFGITSSGDVHTFNIPTASASNRGLLSTTDWSTFNNKQPALGYTAENTANKVTDLTSNDNTHFPTTAAVQTALDTKVTANGAITGATKTKITYDSKGLITAGADLAASDLPTGIDAAKIADGTVSNAEFQYLGGVTSDIQTQIDGKQASGSYLTANQSITLSGDVSGTGTTAITATIGAGKVTNSMLAGSIDLTTKVTSILPVANGGTGVNTITGIVKGNGTSAMTAASAGTDYVAPGAITGVGLTMATARLLGRTTASSGAIEEISVGTGLSLSAGTLSGSDASTASKGIASFNSGNFSVSSGAVSVKSGGIGSTEILDASVALGDMANMATASILGRNTAGTGAPEVLSAATAKSLLSLNNVDNTSDATKNSATATLTNKRITPRVGTTASSSTPTPDADANDIYTVTALAAGATFGAPTGTPTNGQTLLIRIKDNGTARTLAWNAIYRAGTDFALPTTTVISKTVYVQFIYNSADSKWDCIGTTTGFSIPWWLLLAFTPFGSSFREIKNRLGRLLKMALLPSLLLLSFTIQAQMIPICNGWKFRSGGGGGGVPTTNLWAYYEADNGVTQSSGAVSQWNDLSGNGRHLTQATAGSKPTFATNTISFDGTSDFLSVAATIAQQSTIYLVIKLNSTGADQALFGDAQNGYGSWAIASSQFQALDNFGGGVVSSGGTYSNTTTYYLVRFRFNGASSLCQVNNTTAGTGTLGTGTIATPFMIGAISYTGSPVAYGSFTVKAMYIYQGGAGDDTGLKTYTTTKWGLP